MARVVKVARGMPAWRTVATTDVTTGEAKAQVHPRRPQFQALFATQGASGNGGEISYMVAIHVEASKKDGFGKSKGTHLVPASWK